MPLLLLLLPVLQTVLLLLRSCQHSCRLEGSCGW